MNVLVSECQLMSSRPCVMAECYITSTEQNGTMWKGLCSWVDLCREQEVRNRLIGCQESYTKELYDYRWQVLFFSISHITSSSLSAKEKKTRKFSVLTVKLHVCSSDAQTNLFQASKGTLCSQMPCLTSVERDDPIFVFPVLQYPLQEWKTYIFTNPSPHGDTYSSG